MTTIQPPAPGEQAITATTKTISSGRYGRTKGSPCRARGPRLRVAPVYSDVAMEEANDYFRTTLYPAACAFCASASPYAGRSELSVLPATSCVTTVFDQ